MAQSFVHLHVHTHYSLLDGATRIGPMIEKAKACNMPAIAISDHGNMFGAVEFYEAARAAGIKPIIGCETYLASGHRTAKDKDGLKESYHLLLLAMNATGYKNLVRLSSIGYTEGFYRKPRIDKEVLREYSDGLICTSTCIGGEIPQTFLMRDRKAAAEVAETYLQIFGPDRFYIELQDHGMSEQRQLNPELIDLANRLGVGLIATNDVHYLEHDDVEAHDVLCCINTGSLVEDEERFKFPTDQFYFKSSEEMESLFGHYPEALSNTLRVADLCDIELDLGSRHAPVYQVPDSITDDAGTKLTDAEYLRQLVYEGAAERFDEITDEVRERIDYELSVICNKGFASYFLIVWDCVNYARAEGIPVGARGSGCSSVVSFCLFISQPDPIRYGLYFERFMDPDRDEMPDIDLDICQNGRGQVIEYVRDKYGHVAQIITFGTLKAKAVVKDVARVMGMGFEEANKLTKLIPNDLKMTLDKALQQEPELKKKFETDDTVKRILTIGKKLEGGARNAGVHAAGVVVADKQLTNFLPLYKAPGQDTIVTQFDGPTVEKVGLLKMDFLGLRTLTTLERARQLAMKSSGKSIELHDIPLDDKDVYSLFARGDTKGIFQFESGGMRDVLRRMRPNRIEDLIAANALYRPGPMEYIPDYVARKHGQNWTTPHEIMTEVLQETYGIMVYQEQVSRMVNRLGGIELKKAFRLAKAISKKKTAMIDAMREPFIEGCGKNGVSAKVAQEVFDDILKFGGYAFNKAHSTGYAIVAYQTGWMKTYFPVEFMAALMTFEMSSTDKVAEYREACEQMGITIEPPNVNVSDFDFAVGDDAAAGGDAKRRTIHFGLGAIKGVGEKAVQAIIRDRHERGRFRDIFEFCERVDLSSVNRSTIEALVCAGAFDSTGAMRKALCEVLESALASGQTAQQDRKRGQMSLFGKPSGGEEVKQGPVLSTSEWTEAEMLAREKAVLGFYITAHPLASCANLLETCANAVTVDLARYGDGDPVVLGGMVSSLRTVVARGGRNPGRKLGILTLEDLAGRVEGIIFPDDLSKYQALLVPDSIIFVQAEVDRKREEPSLRVEKIVAKEKVLQELTKALLIDIDGTTPLDELVACIKSHRGGCPVFLNVPTQSGQVAQIECNPLLRVDCSPRCFVDLSEIVGREAIKPIGPRRRVIAQPIPDKKDLQRQEDDAENPTEGNGVQPSTPANAARTSGRRTGWSEQSLLIDGIS